MMLLSQKLSSRESRHYGRAADEIARLLALDSFEILDTPPEASFDRLTELAAYVCGVPMSVIGFMDAERQWLKSRHGVDFSEVARKRSFCAYTITGTGLFEVPDTHQDGRFVNHPMVVGEPRLRFYAGVPLLTDDGYALGALCVMDCQPRTLTREQRGHLETLAHQVVSQLELRNRARRHVTEVSARLAPDATLTQQQRMLAGVLEHTDVLIYAKDVEGRFVMANRALEYVTQAGRPLVGGTDYDFFDAALADDFRRNDERIMASREWCVFSEDVVHPDGSVHVYRSTKFPLLDDDGKVLGTGGVSSDVTDLAAARAAHAAAEERWRALVEQSPVAVIVVGADLKLVYVNPEAVALLGGTSAAEFKSVPALDFVPPRMREGARAMLERILAGGVSTRAQRGALRRMDGRDIAVEFNSKPVHDSGELRLQLEVRDVSPLLASHTALKHSAATDPLTGALNRRAWDARVGAMLADPRLVPR